MIKLELLTGPFLFFLMIKFIVELYLNLRNKNCVLKNQHSVPAQFQKRIDLKDHQKAARYTVKKIQLGNFSILLDTVLIIAWTAGGGLQFLAQLSSSWHDNTIFQGIICFGLFYGLSWVIKIPLSFYSTFVLEEQFGFNKSTKKLFFIDQLKGLALAFMIGTPFLAILLSIVEKLESNWWVFGWGFVVLFQLLILWLYPTFIAPLFNKFEKLAPGEVKSKIENLAKKVNFHHTGIFVMDASKRSGHGNAYFTGFGKNKRIVFFDTLLKTLLPEEVEAIMAHELGHFKLKHILKSITQSVVISFIGFYILGQLYNYPPFYSAHGVLTPSSYMALMLFGMVTPVYTFLLTPIFSKLSRKHEFEADEFAAKNSQAKFLISSLVKLYKDNASTLTPDPLYTSFYHSHPPANERISFLESLEEKPKFNTT